MYTPWFLDMIWPSWFDREVTKQYSILPWISYRNESTQSESYLNVSLVIQKKRTVIHNLFSFSDNSLSYKSRNLTAIQLSSGVWTSRSISFSALFSTFFELLPWSLKKYHILPFFNENNVPFFYVWVSLFVLTRVIGRGPNIVIFFNGRPQAD